MKSYIQHLIIYPFLNVYRYTILHYVIPLFLACITAYFPMQATAGTATNEQFRQYIVDICNIPSIPPGWNVAKVTTLCTSNIFTGPSGTGLSTVSANLGTGDAGSSSTPIKNKETYECLDDLKLKPGEKGCATGGWGLLFSSQFSRNIRPETELENGFQSDLIGLLIGLDYRFSDNLIFGAATGLTQDEAAFINNAGSLKTSNNSLTIYSTWLPSEKFSVDGYLGYGVVSFDSKRKIVFGPISGTASGSTSGTQAMAGLSIAYQRNISKASIGPFFNLDYIKTDIKGYNETGTTLLELRHGDRNTISSTASLGVRASYPFKYNWGSLAPSLHGAGVHEFQNNATQIKNELVITPGTGFLVETDAPDRDYFLSGFGLIAEFNNKSQVFLNYERRSGDSLLDAWSVSLGLLKEF